MLHVLCTRLRPGHLSVHVGDSLRRSEEIVKNLELCLSVQLLLLHHVEKRIEAEWLIPEPFVSEWPIVHFSFCLLSCTRSKICSSDLEKNSSKICSNHVNIV